MHGTNMDRSCNEMQRCRCARHKGVWSRGGIALFMLNLGIRRYYETGRFTAGGRSGSAQSIGGWVGVRNGLCILKKRQASSPARIRTTIHLCSSTLFYSLKHWKTAEWATNKRYIARSSEQKMHSLLSCENSQFYAITAIVYTNGFLLLWWCISYRLYRRMLSLPVVTLWILGFYLWHTWNLLVYWDTHRRAFYACQTILKRPGHLRKSATVHYQTSPFGHFEHLLCIVIW
jgi:hypothetical protein